MLRRLSFTGIVTPVAIVVVSSSFAYDWFGVRVGACASKSDGRGSPSARGEGGGALTWVAHSDWPGPPIADPMASKARHFCSSLLDVYRTPRLVRL